MVATTLVTYAKWGESWTASKQSQGVLALALGCREGNLGGLGQDWGV